MTTKEKTAIWERKLSANEKAELIKKYKGKSLKDSHPKISKEWHPTKNGDFTPAMLSHGSGEKAWWLIHAPHPVTGEIWALDWEADVKHRSNGSGCPFLSGQAVRTGFNDLATINPKLASEMHPTKNGDITPYNVTASKKDKVWWLIYAPHPITGELWALEWDDTINHRTHGAGCPFLSGKRVRVGFNDFETLEPMIAAQWHPFLNGNLTPRDVTVSYSKPVYWLCPFDDPFTGKHFDFVWKATVANRTNGKGCPYLSGKAVWPGYNDLATKAPELVPQWHPTKNGDLTPQDITAGSNQKVWWLCECGHEWQAAPCERMRGNGCKRCSSSRGEVRITTFCKNHNIEFCEQYKFDDCIYKRKLPFDVAIFRKDGTLVFVIEFDGRQHDEPVDFSGKTDGMKEFLLTQTRDRIKNEYCKKKGIPLVRISHKNYDNIEKILSKKMTKYGLM